MSDTPEPPYSEEQPTGPTERLPDPEPPHNPADDRPMAEASAGGWIPPGGGYTPHADEPSSSGAPHAGEAPTATMPPAGAPRRLRRSTSDRMVGGVSGGLGRYFDVDPVLFRIAFVVLVFAGGAGILAYLGLWLITPTDGEGQPPSNAGVRALAVIGGIVLVCVALPFLLAGAVIAIPLLPLTLLVLVIILLARGARGKADSDTTDVLARVALVLLVITVSIAAFFAAAAGAALGGGAVIAGVVIALGLALVAAAFIGGGRARWLVLPAVAIAAPLGFVAASELDIKGGMGERSYRPTSLAEIQPRYKLGAGELRIDLRDLRLPDGRTPLNVKMGAGHIVVYVPENVCVSSRIKMGAGYAEVLDRDSGGFDVDWPNVRTPPSGVPVLDLDADVGLGAVEVRHNDERRHARFGRNRVIDRGGADACVPA
jgi:phage shock protein PspC (stress-responsive transcriptional regulator)